MLTKEYVESIGFDIAKQKYYNAHKVDACLDGLKAEVIKLIDENESLRAKLDAAEQSVAELNEKLKNARTVEDADALMARTKADADDFISKTRAFADNIVEVANKRADEIISEAQAVASAVNPVKRNGKRGGSLSMEQLNAISNINNQLEELMDVQSTQIMRIRQAIMMMATDM